MQVVRSKGEHELSVAVSGEDRGDCLTISISIGLLSRVLVVVVVLLVVVL